VPSNTEILKTLLANGEVQVNDSPFFDCVPPPLPPDFDFDRIEGMMLGLAIGDALGTEGGYNLRQRRRDGMVIRDYFDGRGYPSDDSRMAFLTLETDAAGWRVQPGATFRLFRKRPHHGNRNDGGALHYESPFGSAVGEVRTSFGGERRTGIPGRSGTEGKPDRIASAIQLSRPMVVEVKPQPQ
jgi:hypothetical protein